METPPPVPRTRRTTVRLFLACAGMAALLLLIASVAPTVADLVPSGAQSISSEAPAVADPVLVGAGDIAGCDGTGDEATALLLDGIPGTVFTVGDNVYPDGTPEEFANCYHPSWGRHKARTRPAPGNHDYHTAGAAGYYGYFGAAAGDPSQGYYSYDLGSWHIIVLNSNCAAVGGCDYGSPQEQWLRADLAAHPTSCTLAYWHHARFSSASLHGSDQRTQAFWRALYDAGADVVITGHDHSYERFAPQNGGGKLDRQRGMRQFVVGTGGAGLYSIENTRPSSEVHNGATHGVLKLTLRAHSYEWQFIPVTGYPAVGENGQRELVPLNGERFTDAGSNRCHGRRSQPSKTLTFTAVADAYVDSDTANRTFGSAPVLIVDSSSVRESYLKFQLSDVSGPIAWATLRVYVPTEGRHPGSVSSGSVAKMSNTTWSETTVTYNTRPAIDGPVLSTPEGERVVPGQWYEFDVTDAVTGNGTLSLGLKSSTDDAAYYASRESGVFAPQLIVTLAP